MKVKINCGISKNRKVLNSEKTTIHTHSAVNESQMHYANQMKPYSYCMLNTFHCVIPLRSHSGKAKTF